MPIYEYVCSNCNKKFELYVTKDVPQPCPKCFKEVEKVFSRPSPFQWGHGGLSDWKK